MLVCYTHTHTHSPQVLYHKSLQIGPTNKKLSLKVEKEKWASLNKCFFKELGTVKKQNKTLGWHIFVTTIAIHPFLLFSVGFQAVFAHLYSSLHAYVIHVVFLP